ncbi:recombination mediator RecR [Treponema pedis]|nr:recombination mediator RecR [Treponema pedis]QOW60443.1 recombination protein RecR [Treponema pedis]QSI05780.1 recombination protein RecR [Treponema pedis]
MNAIEDVIDCFSRLPGIGNKSAARIAYHLLKQSPEEAKRLARAVSVLHEKIHPCSICGSFTEDEICSVCSDNTRDKSTICVVGFPQDVNTIAAIPEYRGLFHVLGALIAPLEGIGPDNLRISELIKRIHEGGVTEVILATNPTIEGDTTALYIQKVLQDLPVKITRLASGLPVGGDLEYADRLTLARSFNGRVKF